MFEHTYWQILSYLTPSHSTCHRDSSFGQKHSIMYVHLVNVSRSTCSYWNNSWKLGSCIQVEASFYTTSVQMNTIVKHCTITIRLLACWYRAFQSRYTLTLNWDLHDTRWLNILNLHKLSIHESQLRGLKLNKQT